MKALSYNDMFEHIEKLARISKEEYLISIVIPVYNEEKTIFSILKNLPESNKIEIIVIDDNSHDNSVLEIEKAQNSRLIKLYKHKKNKGYGKAILTGIKKSKGKIIVTMDADGQHIPDDIYSLVKPILDGDADYTIGSRYMGSFHYVLPISTRLGEVLVEVLLRLLFGQKVKNNQGGFRAFDRKIIHIFNNIQYKSFAFTTELIIKAALYGYRIRECPIRLMDRIHGSSRIILNKLALNLFICFFRYFSLKIKSKMFKRERISFKKDRLLFKEIK
ncbi:MAG: glycosyltransferase family 2 protein [Promethearchaeota archaeon]